MAAKAWKTKRSSNIDTAGETVRAMSYALVLRVLLPYVLQTLICLIASPRPSKSKESSAQKLSKSSTTMHSAGRATSANCYEAPPADFTPKRILNFALPHHACLYIKTHRSRRRRTSLNAAPHSQPWPPTSKSSPRTRPRKASKASTLKPSLPTEWCFAPGLWLWTPLLARLSTGMLRRIR